MQAIHVSIHALPRGTQPGGEVLVEGRALRTLSIGPQPGAVPLGVTFEQARDALVPLPRMVFEPDGSFVWVGSVERHSPVAQRNSGLGTWQLEGVLYDQGERLSHVEVSGSCNVPVPAWEQFLAALGWPQAALMFQLLAQAVFLDEATFRQMLLEGRRS